MDKLPKGWCSKQISNIAFIRGGKRIPKGYTLQEEKTEFPYIRVSDFNDNGSIDLHNLRFITKEIRDQISNYTISSNDIYISIAGTIGKTGIIPKELDGANLTENAAKLVFKNIDQINKWFILYFTQTTDFKDQAGLATRIVAMPKLALSRLSDIQIPLPSISEQSSIVNKLDVLFDHIDRSIDLLEENIKHTKGLMASVLEEVFVNGKNWKRLPLNKVAKVERGKSKHRPRNDQKLFGDSYPFIQTGDVRSANKYIDKYEVCYSEFGLKQSRLWKKGTICLTIAANIGDVAILGFDACFPDSVVGITPNSMNNEFLYYYLKTLQLQLDKKANSAAQKNINLKILSEIDVPVPSIEIQNSIADRFSRLEEKQFQILLVLQSKLTYLKALKSSLLDRAFKGEL